MQLKNKYLDYWVQGLLVLNAILFAFPSKYKAYPVILLVIFSFYYRIKSNSKDKYDYRKIIYAACPLILILLSCIISFNKIETINKISTMSSLIVFPIVFASLKSGGFVFDRKKLMLFSKIFILSTISFSIFTFVYFWNKEFNFSQTIEHYSNLINIRLGLFSIHPIYNSIIIGISIIMLFYLFKYTNSNFSKFVYCICFAVLCVFLSILMRKGPIIFLFISLLIFLYFYFSRKFILMGSLVFLVILVCSISFLPKYHNYNRFEEFFNSNNKDTIAQSTKIRSTIYTCVFEKIKEKPFLGYGIGNSQKYLNDCYDEKELQTFKFTYNSHNQYLSFVLNCGFLGFIFYLFSTSKIVSFYINKKNYLAVSIILFFLLNFLTENVIEREIGVMLYSYFISMFYFFPESVQE